MRDLVDAGVFVFTGGKPRTKTKDSDPISQFKLTFRRIYGLTNFIGLAERDRFELSGADLEEWLSNTANGKEILLRNLGGGLTQDESDADEIITGNDDVGELFTEPSGLPLFPELELQTAKVARAPLSAPTANTVSISITKVVQLGAEEIGAVVLGLGFEERTLKSATTMMAHRRRN